MYAFAVEVKRIFSHAELMKIKFIIKVIGPRTQLPKTTDHICTKIARTLFTQQITPSRGQRRLLSADAASNLPLVRNLQNCRTAQSVF